MDLMIFLSLILSTWALAANNKATALFRNVDFWQIPNACPDLCLPLEINYGVSTWQINYELKSGVLTIGGKQIPGEFTAITINKAPATPEGVLALSRSYPLIFRAMTKDRQVFEWSLIVKDIEVHDVHLRNDGYYILIQSNRGKTEWGQNAMSPTLPRMPEVKTQTIEKTPARLIHKDENGFERELIVTDLTKVPTPDSRIKPFSRHLGSYGTELSFYWPDTSLENTELQTIELKKYGIYETEISEQGLKYRVPTYRIAPTEASGRFSGLSTGSNSLILNGELALAHYFDNPFGGTFQNWHSHRYGTRVRAFGALTNLSGLSFSTPVNIFFGSAEARVFLNQGLWNLDEIIGAQVSMNQFQFLSLAQNYVGVGGFWSRSMPEVFDSVLRKMRWFEHPKYVDLDFTYLHPLSGSTGNFNYILNFHGKMFLADEWFVEAGFGLFEIKVSSSRGFSSLTGTVGFGLIF